MSRFDSLDHWRGIACLLVIVYHSTLEYLAAAPAASHDWSIAGLLQFTHYFNVGVALFFVISGYCIAAAADNARHRSGSIRTYFIRRFRRIYPPFWIVVLLSIGAFFLLDYGWRAPVLSGGAWPQYRPSWFSASQWIGNFTLTESWRYHVYGGMKGQFVGQAWTLNYEEQFYFVTGMLLVVSRKWFFPGVAIVSIATAIVTLWARAAGVHVDGFFFDGAWLLFAVGVAVFYRIRYATGWRARAIDALLVAAIPLSLWVSVPIYGAVAGFVFAAALPWLYRFDRQVTASFALKPLLICGQMCYSLYLVHQIPVKAVTTLLYRYGVTSAVSTLFVVIPVSVAVSIGLGWLFHLHVERRFLNAPLRESRGEPDVAVAGVPAAVSLQSGKPILFPEML